MSRTNETRHIKWQETCKCKYRLDQSVCNNKQRWNEDIEKTRLVEKTSAENENKYKCSSCTVYIVLFSIIFTINIGISIYFVYYKNVSKHDYVYQI